MSQRTVEIDDDLQDRVEEACNEVRECLEEFLKENPDTEELPCISNDLDYSGTIRAIVDSAVPVYTSHIEGLWYLYSRKFEEAYEDAGFGTNPKENDGMTSIYCYIDQEVHAWYDKHAQDIFDAWKEKRDSEAVIPLEEEEESQ